MKPAIFILNNPTAPRICPELAAEIGLNESILLLQIEFWIRVSNSEEHDGRQWTYQSTRKIQEAFPFWGLATINRAIQSLEKQHLLIIGKYNRLAYDMTRWFAVDMDGCAKLKSVRVGGHDTHSTQNGTASTQNGTASTQNGTDSAQNGTTIPETTTENTAEITTEGTPTDSPPPKKNKKLPEEPRPAAIDVYRLVANRFPDRAIWEGIGKTVSDSTADLERWEKVIRAWIAMGWNKTNVKGMLQYFVENKIPGDDPGWRNGKSAKRGSDTIDIQGYHPRAATKEELWGPTGKPPHAS
jgi:hypothetical protein